MADNKIEIFLQNYSTSRSIFYKNRSKCEELLLEFKNITKSTGYEITDALEVYLERDNEDYFLNLFNIYALFKYGKFKAAKNLYTSFVNYLFKLKKYQWVKRAEQFLEDVKSGASLNSSYINKMSLIQDGVIIIDSDEIFELDISDVKRNPDVFFRHSDCIRSLNSLIKYQSAKDMLEVYLKAIPIIKFDTNSCRFLAEVAQVGKSGKINEALLKVKQEEQFEFELLRVEESRRRKPEETYEMNIEFDYESDRRLEIEDEWEVIANCREALYFEDLNKEQVLHTIYQMALSYEKVGKRITAKKLFGLVRLKDPGFRRVAQRLDELE